MSVDVTSGMRERVEVRLAGQRELMLRFGDANERRWADHPDGPLWSAGQTLDRVWQVTHNQEIGDRQRTMLANPDGPAPAKDDVIAALRFADEAHRDIEHAEFALIKFARSAGATWPELAEALGLASPQAAQQRFGRIASRLGLADLAEREGGDDGR